MFSFYPDLLYFKKNILISFVIQSYLIKYYWIFLFFKTRVNSNDVTLGFFFLRNVILGISRYLVVAVKRIYIAYLFSFERGFLSYKHKTYSNFLFQNWPNFGEAKIHFVKQQFSLSEMAKFCPRARTGILKAPLLVIWATY